MRPQYSARANSRGQPMLRIELEDIAIDIGEPVLGHSRSDLIRYYWSGHPRFLFFQSVPYGAKFLDLGAGSGGLSGWKRWGIPPREDIRMFALDKIQHSDYARYEDFRIVDVDQGGIPYPPDFFDAVYASHILEHIANLEGAIAGIKKTLKPGGQVYVEVPTPETKAYPPREDLAKQGLEVAASSFFDDRTHLDTYSADGWAEQFRQQGFKLRQYGIIRNPYLEEELLSLGVKTNDRELMTYGLWSRLCWAQYLVLEADCGNAKEPDHET